MSLRMSMRRPKPPPPPPKKKAKAKAKPKSKSKTSSKIKKPTKKKAAPKPKVATKPKAGPKPKAAPKPKAGPKPKKVEQEKFRKHGLARVVALKAEAEAMPGGDSHRQLLWEAAETLAQEIELNNNDPQLSQEASSFKSQVDAVSSVDMLNDTIEAARPYVNAEMMRKLEQVRDAHLASLQSYELKEKKAAGELGLEAGTTVEGLIQQGHAQMGNGAALDQHMQAVEIAQKEYAGKMKEVNAHRTKFGDRRRSKTIKLLREANGLRSALCGKIETQNMASVLKQHIRNQVASDIDRAVQDANQILDELPFDVRKEIAKGERERIEKRREDAENFVLGIIRIKNEVGWWDK